MLNIVRTKHKELNIQSSGGRWSLQLFPVTKVIRWPEKTPTGPWGLLGGVSTKSVANYRKKNQTKQNPLKWRPSIPKYKVKILNLASCNPSGFKIFNGCDLSCNYCASLIVICNKKCNSFFAVHPDADLYGTKIVSSNIQWRESCRQQHCIHVQANRSQVF